MKKRVKQLIRRIVGKVHDEVSRETINFFFKRNIPVQNIPNYKTLYQACRMAGMEFLYFNDINREIYFKTSDGLRVFTDDYFWVFIEILCDKRYGIYDEFVDREYIVFDVGANRGYASLLFALDSRCRSVYSFEPCKKPYEMLRQHLGLNVAVATKVSAFNYGLSGESARKVFNVHPSHDGVSSGNQQFVNSFLDGKRKSELVSEEVVLRCASEVIAELLDISPQHRNLQRCLKVDIEGAEYEVLTELKEANMLCGFDLIFGECHMGIEAILEIVGDDFELNYLAKEPVEGLYSFVLANAKEAE